MCTVLRQYKFMTILALLLVVGCATTDRVQKRSMPGVENYSEISEAGTFAGSQVGFGGATDPAAMPALKAAGYTTVISLRAETEEGVDHAASREAAERAGLKYVVLPFSPKESPPEAVDGVLDAMASPAGQPVYLHCGSASRAAAIWMVGRVSRDGVDRSEAAAELRAIAAKPDKAEAFADQFLEEQSR